MSSGRRVCFSIVRFNLLLFVLALCCGASLAQQPKVLAPHRELPPKLEAAMPLPKGVPGSIVTGPWMIGANLKSTIYVKNLVETSAVPVSPILYLSNGKELPLTPVELAPAGIAVIDVNAELQALGIAPYATLSGYVEIQYSWPWEPICATVRNLDALHSLIFDYGARSTNSLQLAGQPPPSPEPRPITFDGMWWKQEPNVTGFVAITNTTTRTITAHLELTDHSGSNFARDVVTVSGHGTKLVDLNELLSAPTSEGGIAISYIGSENDLLIGGGLQDQTNGYSASLHFSMPMALPPVANVSIAELGLMTGPADPMLKFPAGIAFTPYTVLRNASSHPLTATPTFWWTAGGTAHSGQLPALTLRAGETRMLDIPPMLAAAGLKNFSGSISLVFDVQGDPAGLLMSGGSVDQKYSYVFGVVPKGVNVSGAKNLSYWSIGDGDDTMVTLWNAADEPQNLIFRLMFPGGHYDFPISLGPRATHMFNISEIVHSQLPDSEGNVIPAGILEGSAELMGAGRTEVDSILVAMDAGIYNVKKATCGTYSCETCNGVTDGSLYPLNSFSMADGSTTQLNFIETWNSGIQYNMNGSSTWGSSTSAASVSSSGLVTGDAVGSSYITAHDKSYEPTYTANFCGTNLPSCPVQQPTQPGGGSKGTIGAIPVEFSLDTAEDAGGGDLHLIWIWASSSGSGHLSDLSSCSITENVTYTGTGNFAWPAPFPAITSTNPTNVSVPGQDGQVADDHDLNGKFDTDFRKPYKANSFVAKQTISYSCTYGGKTLSGTLFGAADITRSVRQNANGRWSFTVTEPIEGTDYSATINPLP